MAGGGEEETKLEFTPTWVVALVCLVIIAISLFAERLLHYGGNFLKKWDQKPLYEALQKIKEELMLLGFISLLLTATQNLITKFCIPSGLTPHMLLCEPNGGEGQKSKTPTSHFQSFFSSPHISGTARRLLAGGSSSSSYCALKNKVPLLSLEAIHHLHIFIFVLAVVHVVYCVLTVLFGALQIRRWKHWEDLIAKDNYDTQKFLEPKITHVHQHAFIKDRFVGFGKGTVLMGWLHSFFKQFYGSVTESDYKTLRQGFIMNHCKSNPKFNFHNYMIRTLEDDFKQVVGISWYLWIFVVIFLLLDVGGWHTYFWMGFIPFILLLAVGTKLEHVIIQLAHEVAEKHAAIEGELIVQPSDDHFWFGRPQVVLFLIHFILFQNSFEIALFFWIWLTYGIGSCMMGQISFIVPRLVIGLLILVLCSYSTLPLYTLVTQMGTHFKKAIFEEHVQVGLVRWAKGAKKKKEHGNDHYGQEIPDGESSPVELHQMDSTFNRASAPDGKPEGSA